MNKKNILHLVLGCKNKHYQTIENVSKKTWMTNSPDNIKTIFMYGGQSSIFWDGEKSFYVDKAESHTSSICLYKTIKAFEWFYESNFDYIYRTNCTGYFDLNLVSEFVSDKPDKNFYCGYVGEYNNIKFASGASFFLTKDIVEKIIDNQDMLFSYQYPGWMDDVSIGKFVTEYLNINLDKTITSNNFRKIVTPENISNNLNMSYFHYYIEPRNSKLKNITEEYCNILYKIHDLKVKGNYL